MTGSVQHWVDRGFADVDLGDARLDRRLRSIMVDLARHCGKTIAGSLDGWARIEAAYRFFDDERVVPEPMLAPHIGHAAERIAVSGEHTVLPFQDTTYLDHGRRPKTHGLDKVPRYGSGTATEGLMLHDTLAVTTEGLPFGPVDQRCIDRKQFADADRHDPDAPCDAVPDRTERVLPYRKIHKTKKAPGNASTMREALRWIARLDGFIDRPPIGPGPRADQPVARMGAAIGCRGRLPRHLWVIGPRHEGRIGSRTEGLVGHAHGSGGYPRFRAVTQTPAGTGSCCAARTEPPRL